MKMIHISKFKPGDKNSSTNGPTAGIEPGLCKRFDACQRTYSIVGSTDGFVSTVSSLNFIM